MHMQLTSVPGDFPRNPFPASLAGYQPKVAACLIDGQYVVGLTNDERQSRHSFCADLVEQLSVYLQKKLAEFPVKQVAELLPQINTWIQRQDWELGQAEYRWIMKTLEERFHVGDSCAQDQMPDTKATPLKSSRFRPSVPNDLIGFKVESLQEVLHALKKAIGDQPPSELAQRANVSIEEVQAVLNEQQDYRDGTIEALLTVTGLERLILDVRVSRFFKPSDRSYEGVPSLVDHLKHL